MTSVLICISVGMLAYGVHTSIRAVAERLVRLRQERAFVEWMSQRPRHHPPVFFMASATFELDEDMREATQRRPDGVQ